MVTQLQLGNIAVDVVFKDIKHVHLSVHPTTGRVRISAPTRMSLDPIRFCHFQAGLDQEAAEEAPGTGTRDAARVLESREPLRLGQRYLLKVIECDGAPSIELKHDEMLLRLRPAADSRYAKAVVEEWYRDQIKKAVPSLIAKWESVMGVKVARFFVRQMKTRWGSCNSRTRSIRLNTELAKKPPDLLEYVVVHEMAHLIVRGHNDRFKSIMGQYLPNWRLHRQALNSAPLGYETWRY